MTLDIKNLLFDEDIYKEFRKINRRNSDFKLPQYEDLQGWGGHKAFFRPLIKRLEPETIFEVGTWKGKSAINIADCCRDLNLRTQIICIDTWLGATEFWMNKQDKKRYKSLRLRAGFPTVYYQFLYNVIYNKHEDKIVPFPQTSVNAARFFTKNEVKCDLAYIDGSHEYEDVYQDINYYLSLSNGIIVGDDYCDYWPGVMNAVKNIKNQRYLAGRHVKFKNSNKEPYSDYWILYYKDFIDVVNEAMDEMSKSISFVKVERID